MYLAIIKSILAKVVTKLNQQAFACCLQLKKSSLKKILSYKRDSVWCKIDFFCPLQWQIYNKSKDWILE